ncbi:ABC transporter permease [Streptomyces sp. 21So2-11]|uniref:ABC transporter permease n=1 Tax=Streptomyces sp. 21So2-11 TaxID=3144408 RepID=UPI00321A391D
MTAPLTPPHQQPPNDPWQKSDAGTVPPFEPAVDEGPGLSTEVARAALVVAALTVAGVALGLLWMWLAPRVPLVSTDKAVFLQDTEGEEAVGADGTFVLLALAFGAVSAAVVFWFNRRGGVPLVVALLLGGLFGSLLAWGIGVWGGPDDVVARAREVGQGVPFDAPLELAAKGALLAWPLAALLVHLALTALFGPRDPEPEWEMPPYYGAPMTAPEPPAGYGPGAGGAGPVAPPQTGVGDGGPA